MFEVYFLQWNHITLHIDEKQESIKTLILIFKNMNPALAVSLVSISETGRMS